MKTNPKAARPPRRWEVVMFALVAGTLGAVVGYAAAGLLPGLMAVGDFSKAQRLGVLALSAPAVALGILVHELGHVAGGKLAGFRFLLLLVGPLKLQRTPDGLKVGLNLSTNLAGGLACLLPEDDRNLRRRMALFIAGGPLASLALGVGAALAGWAWYGNYSPLSPPGYPALLGSLGLLITGGISMALFAVSAFPGAASGFATDGRRLAMLLRTGPAAEREAALVMLTSAALTGLRARDYPPQLVARLEANNDGSVFGLMGRLMAYYHWLDRGEAARAGELLAEVVAGAAGLPAMTRDSVHAEHAYWLAVHGGDVAGAREALGLAGRSEFDPATKLRAEAAVLRAEGDAAGATAKADAALLALRKRSLAFKPGADHVEWIEALRG